MELESARIRKQNPHACGNGIRMHTETESAGLWKRKMACGNPLSSLWWRRLMRKVDEVDEEAGKLGTFWPGEWLSSDFPEARMFSLKYKVCLSKVRK